MLSLLMNGFLILQQSLFQTCKGGHTHKDPQTISSWYHRNVLNGNRGARQMCPEMSYEVIQGHVTVEGSLSYQVVCRDGYVMPWGTKSQSFVYKCQYGNMFNQLPRFCTTPTEPLIKVTFSILPIVPINGTANLCHEKKIQQSIEKGYNESIRQKPGKFNHSHFAYISKCSSCGEIQSELEIIVTGIQRTTFNKEQENRTSDFTEVILSAFRVFLQQLNLHGFDLSDANTKGLNYVRSESSIVGFHCKNIAAKLRQDGGRWVCVGCGKGWWLDLETDVCHPCGPGFYNDDDSAAKCKVCPVKFQKAPWAAQNIDECFHTDKFGNELQTLMTAIVVSFTYAVLVITVIIVWSRIIMSKYKQPTKHTVITEKYRSSLSTGTKSDRC